jgi:hypothetical protein
LLESRYSSKFSKEEQEVLEELMKSPTMRAMIASGCDRHTLKDLMVTETVYTTGVCARLAEKVCRLINEGKVKAEDICKKQLTETSAAPEGQDIALAAPELAAMQPQPGAADKGCTQNQPVQGDKVDSQGAKPVVAEPLAQPTPVAATPVESTEGEKEEEPKDEEGEEEDGEEKEEKEPEKSMAEKFNDAPSDKFGGAMHMPEGKPVPVSEDDVSTPGEVKDPESTKADAEQSLDGIEPVAQNDALDQGPAVPSLESVCKDGLTISEKLAFALTEDASKKFEIKEGTEAWVRLFKAALHRVRSFGK